MSTTRLVAELMRFVVLDKIAALRKRSYAELRAMPEESVEEVPIEDRQVPITVVVNAVANNRLRVTVQGWAESRFLGTSVFTNGFIKNADETIDSMEDRDFDDYA